VSQYDLDFNYDGVFLRNVIVGFINLLDGTISWKNRIGQGETREVRVPFYYGTAGQERYLQDNFLNDVNTDPNDEKAEGPFNKVPRGLINLTSVNVVTGDISNKSIPTNYQSQQADGTLLAMRAETFWIPLELQFKATIMVATLLDHLRVTELLLGNFYKNRPFRVDVVSTRIDCVASIPEAIDGERMMNFRFEDRKKYSVECTINVRTAMPAYAPGSEMFRGTRIEGFEHNADLLPRGQIQNPPIQLNTSRGTTGISANTGATSLPRITTPLVQGSTSLGPVAWPVAPTGPFPPR
jgi:hypothetical protein